jgi:hypothetical protein
LVLEVTAPVTDSTPVLELIRDLAGFHLGAGSERTRSRLLAMGVAPEDHGAGSKPGEPTRKRVQARPGADLVGHATRWAGDYGTVTGFAHKILSALDCTGAIGRANAFLPHSERFASIRVGGQ